MLYNTGTIAINGNTATGTGTNWTAPVSQVRAGQTIIVMSNPVQLFQISSVNSATSMTVTPAASPALSGQKYGILVSDNISVDGLAQAMSQLIKEYDENIGAWETFATTSANQNITVTINGTPVTIPGIGKLAQKGSNGALAIADGGTGATTAADARSNLGLGISDRVVNMKLCLCAVFFEVKVPRIADIQTAFHAAIQLNPKGYRYLSTDSFIGKLRGAAGTLPVPMQTHGLNVTSRTSLIRLPTVASTVIGSCTTWGGYSDGGAGY